MCFVEPLFVRFITREEGNMTRRFLWGLLAVVMAFGTAGCGAKETPAPATVSGQPAGAEKTGGEKNAGGEAVTETSASQSAKDDGKTYPATVICIILC